MTSVEKIFAIERFNTPDSAPLYMRIKKLVQDAIGSEELKQGDSVPSERDVADLLQVSRVTVRKAFSELVDEGLLVQSAVPAHLLAASGRALNNRSRVSQVSAKTCACADFNQV